LTEGGLASSLHPQGHLDTQKQSSNRFLVCEAA
jgi:hypothetical protein